MKVGSIVKTNVKGQIVIPKEYRDYLNITENTHMNIVVMQDSLLLTPINSLNNNTNNIVFREILKRTAGKWGKVRPDEIRKENRLKKDSNKKIQNLKKVW